MDYANSSYYILCMIFFISIVVLWNYININSYYHSFIITLVIYILSMALVAQYIMKSWTPINLTNCSSIFSWCFITNFVYENSIQILMLLIIISILIKIVFVSMMIDLLLYGRGQLKHTKSNNNYTFNTDDIKNAIEAYTSISYLSYVIVILNFIFLLFLNSYDDAVQKKSGTSLLIPLYLVPIAFVIIEVYYSNTLHKIKEHGNMLYDVSKATPHPANVATPVNKDLNALSYSKSQLPINYTNYFGWANRW